jgi:hypothetical protein
MSKSQSIYFSLKTIKSKPSSPPFKPIAYIVLEKISHDKDGDMCLAEEFMRFDELNDKIDFLIEELESIRSQGKVFFTR